MKAVWLFLVFTPALVASLAPSFTHSHEFGGQDFFRGQTVLPAVEDCAVGNTNLDSPLAESFGNSVVGEHSRILVAFRSTNLANLASGQFFGGQGFFGSHSLPVNTVEDCLIGNLIVTAPLSEGFGDSIYGNSFVSSPFSVGFGESSFDRPATVDTAPQRIFVDATNLSPFSDTMGFSIVGQTDVVTSVSNLFQVGSPSHIAWFIVPIVIDSVQGMLGSGFRADIFNEEFERSFPPLADGDTSATIFGPRWVVGVEASFFHRSPGVVFRFVLRPQLPLFFCRYGGQSFFNRPVVLKSADYGFGWNISDDGPIMHRQRLVVVSNVGNKNRWFCQSPVPRLYCFVSPLAVVRTVIPIHVDSIQRKLSVRLGLSSHIVNEELKRISPAGTDSDTAPAVIIPPISAVVVAPADHAVPRSEFGRKTTSKTFNFFVKLGFSHRVPQLRCGQGIDSGLGPTIYSHYYMKPVMRGQF